MGKPTEITLESLKAEQIALGDKIALFEAKASTEFFFPSTEIALKHGEHYAGLILGKNGEPSYHLVLLSGHAKDINWADAGKWAKKAGGELPTRREQALLYANLKEEFEGTWYWSAEEHAGDSDYAWVQGFSSGGQSNYRKDGKCRARAVRRLTIE